MTLLIILFLVTLVLFALFWGGGLVAQGYLYQQPADRLPIRALAGALLVGSFNATIGDTSRVTARPTPLKTGGECS